MSVVTVIGSGATGVHFALTLLEKGREVRLIDVGFTGPDPVLPESDMLELKRELDDPWGYFLGEGLGSAVLPQEHDEVYDFPPAKEYAFRPAPGFAWDAEGFEPLHSFARGGLAEAWTAGCYPFTPEETGAFPFDYGELSAGYDEVAGRIGISGEDDDLARFFPVHENLQPPHPLDEHSARLLARYARRRGRINRLGCWVGRTRVAALSRPLGDRPACTRLGRCLWGCPTRAFYTPALTLEACRRYPGFRYEPGIRVLRYETEGRRVMAIEGRRTSGEPVRLPVDHLVLAAGALSSAEIHLRSLHSGAAAGGPGAGPDGRPDAPEFLDGLMDNRQVLVPFVHPAMVGRRYQPRTYQYHLLGMGIEGPDPTGYVHCQITTLKTALVHPVIQKLPFGLAHGTKMVAAIHAALGVVNVNLHDTRRPGNRAEWRPDLGEDGGLRFSYAPASDEPARLEPTLRRLRKALRLLGCIAPPNMTHLRPMGSSVHYAGLLPMTADGGPGTTTPTGRSRRHDNLHFVDGITFPSLPAKNLTFTLMANAVRIARADF